MILVSHRGTQTISEGLRDAAFFPSKIRIDGLAGKVHTGFLKQFKLLRKDLDRLIAKDETRPIFVFGHSLGGAAATITGLYLKHRGLDIWSLYTSGQPVVGDQVYQGLPSPSL